MKTFKKIAIILILIIIYAYVSNITNIPNSMILFQGENLNLKTMLGITINSEEEYLAMQASTSLNEKLSENSGKTKISLNLFGNIPLKDVNVSVLPKTTVIPIGSTIGLKLYTEGVLVVGMSEIENEKPYEGSGIKEGDTILAVNGNEISSTEELISTINKYGGSNIQIEYSSNGEIKQTQINPSKTEENEYKLGLWVRDAAAGVGTITFYEPSTKTFAALGHGIQDIDTEKLINIASGEVVTANIIDITKGEKGEPGEIRGNISQGTTLGKISKNTAFGIYGELENTSKLQINQSQEMEVASRDEIQTGKANIICSLEDGQRQEYEIEIQKIYKNNNENNKSMLIKVTDKELLEKTGGIIQGMSGSPIIQNGKFIGAVTHVLINDPEMGYAVFGDIMIKQSREVE